MATDFLGNELAVGDEVVFVNYNGTSADLEKGVITKVFKEQAEVNGRKRRAEYKFVKLSTTKAEPVEQGRWIIVKDALGKPYSICDRCKVVFAWKDEYGTLHNNDMSGCHYCPNCGAKMGG